MTLYNFLHDIFLAPFVDFAFMKRALAACFMLALSATPLGVFMNLRRMTLIGDAVSHAILPGVAIAFLMAGLSVWGMTAGGLATGIIVALSAIFLSRTTLLRDDAAFTLVYLLSLAAGITLVSLQGSSVELMHILFGNILGIDNSALVLIAGVSILTITLVLGNYRALVIDSFDADFITRRRGFAATLFFLLLVINLVAAFQALGTLMALGLMILPALAARFWTRTVDTLLPVSIALALVAAYAGLVISYHGQLPTGPAVVLAAGVLALTSALIGRHGSVRQHYCA